VAYSVGVEFDTTAAYCRASIDSSVGPMRDEVLRPTTIRDRRGLLALFARSRAQPSLRGFRAPASVPGVTDGAVDIALASPSEGPATPPQLPSQAIEQQRATARPVLCSFRGPCGCAWSL
jgi:hypothetical protein